MKLGQNSIQSFKKAIIISIVWLPTLSFASAPLDSILKVLNQEIANQEIYRQKKEYRITSLRQDLYQAKNDTVRFSTASMLFDEYRCYQSDSAYYYAKMMGRIAENMNYKAGIVSSKIAQTDYFTSIGLFKEACDVNSTINRDDVQKDQILAYYSVNARLYYNLGAYVGDNVPELSQQYYDIRNDYYKKLTHIAPINSYEYNHAVLALHEINGKSPLQNIKMRLKFLDTYDITDHEKAIQYSMVGHSYLGLKHYDEAKYYLAVSAIYDIRTNTYETTSAKMLAELMYKDGDYTHAYTYIHLAFNDATFYNSHLRREEIIGTLKMIENSRYGSLVNRMWHLGSIAFIITLLLMTVAILLYKFKKANRHLKALNERLDNKTYELEQKQIELAAINDKLSKILDQLKETTAIKDEYIMQSLYVNTFFVNQVEEKAHKVVKMVKNEQYDKLMLLPYQMGIKEERQRIFKQFDNAFLSLFPNFVDELNKLFDKDNQIVLNADGGLPVEVRIFALMRLNISVPSVVAKYLNLSTKTVYVYKTKMKSRSIVDNNDFEKRIMEIPKP